jgi:glycosyltransferase involved in cell wall biosynthesis
MSIGGLFAVGMVAANRDKSRKQFPIQEAAFMKFHRRHPDSVLIMHTEESNPHGLELRRMAERIGLVPGSYRFSAQYLLAAGMVPPAQVSGTMGACDVGLQATAAEGFGLPIGEFLASGTPVIGTDHPVHAQVIGPGGWLAEAEDLWATGHEAWWRAARVSSLVKLLDLAYHGARPGAEQGRGCADPAKAARAYALRKAAARQHVADNFSYDLVRDRHLRPVLAQLGEHFGMD